MRYIVEMRSNSVHEEGYACANVFVWLCMVQWGKKTKQKQAAVPVCMEREPRDCMVINLLSNISQNPLPLFTVMAFYMYPKHADMSMHSNLKTARNSLLLKLSNHTKGTTNFAKNKVGRYTLWILRELGPEPTDIPELFPGDKHLGQTLQLGSLLLHGVPDAVHLSTETRSKGRGGCVSMHPNVHHCFLGDKRIKNHRIGQRRGEDPCADDKQCTDTSVSAYPSSTMESGEGRLAGIPWMKAKKGIIPSRETRATMPGVRRKNNPGSASVRLQLHQQFSTFSSLDWKKKPKQENLLLQISACMHAPSSS